MDRAVLHLAAAIRIIKIQGMCPLVLGELPSGPFGDMHTKSRTIPLLVFKAENESEVHQLKKKPWVSKIQ